MAFAPGTAAASQARPSAGGVSSAKKPAGSGSANKSTATTHTVRIAGTKDYFNGIRIWENTNDYGTSLSLSVSEPVPAGTHLTISTKKDFTSNFCEVGDTFNVRIDKQYYNGLEMAAVESKFGVVIDLVTKEDLQPGKYFVNKRRAKTDSDVN